MLPSYSPIISPTLPASQATNGLQPISEGSDAINSLAHPRTTGRILLIEPDTGWRQQLTALLQRAGHTVITAVDGLMGLTQFALEEQVDLVLVAAYMPGLSGLNVCLLLRRHSYVPVILLSDYYHVEDALYSLQQGVDAYFDRSSQPAILLARMQACLRRHAVGQSAARDKRLVVDDLVIDHDTGVVTVGEQPVNLTPVEQRLLFYLIECAGRLVSSPELLQAVWGYSTAGTNLLKVAIHRLRKKIESDPEHPVHIVNEYGGYRFCLPSTHSKV